MTLRTAVERISGAGATSFLAVLKRFGPGNDAPLSFPMRRVDADDRRARRHRAGLAELLDGLDRLVVDAGRAPLPGQGQPHGPRAPARDVPAPRRVAGDPGHGWTLTA